MKYSVTVDGILSDCTLSEEEIDFTSSSTSVKIKVEDIIGCEVVPAYFFFRRYALYVWYIQTQEKKLTKASIHITGDEDVCEKLRTEIQEKLQCLPKRPKSLLVLINPIGGNKTALKDFKNTVEPVFKLAAIKCDVIVSERAKHMIDTAKNYDLKGTDGIVILGGDGSFSEVVNVLMRKEQDKAGINIDDPAAQIRPITMPIGMIPTGSGNFVALKGTGFVDVLNSTLHVLKGNVFRMNMVGVYADNKLVDYAGVTATYRGFSDMLYHADKCRWLGRLRYLIVPLWLSFFRPYLQTFEAEVTYHTDDVTESETSVDPNVSQKDILIAGKKVIGVKTHTKDTVVVSRKLRCIGLGNTNEKDEMNGQVFSSTNFDDTMTELQLLKFLKDALNQKQEELEVEFAKSVTIHGVKAKIKYDQEDDGSENDKLKRLILVDGEFYEIKDLEFQYWLHQRVVPLFSSAL